MPDDLDAKLVALGEKAKAILKERGLTNAQIDAELRKKGGKKARA